MRENFHDCCTLVEKTILRPQQRYRRLANMYIFWFRLIGGLEIILSVTLPIFLIVLNPQEPDTQIILTVISVSVALLAALRSFFGWQENWQAHRAQENILSGILADWEIEMMKISGSGSNNARSKALQQTQESIAAATQALDTSQEMLASRMRAPVAFRSNHETRSPNAQ
ncbi:DUF4231 domain-containing protein [Streptomyces prasinopilosus]|uniref:DUF4231 domain-containing protein n=1 Tax=Streptomyces prasinopilosus TaxID=67344 RepID=UPI0006E246F3|nr:DUF4231 domain-containing protein [Streptomyces prasinopilosus]